ncbi:hypothetical protein AMS68_007630 [Peltaster fructicola]|uniref:Uncharacterized protein n=1 Tax=Peltaster fructicola TaxID=286661 RepID=A0A6H0Y534_9PEZI|nr:hypothetical protein AMS68_007630 [Peltaster fructicola]
MSIRTSSSITRRPSQSQDSSDLHIYVPSQRHREDPTIFAGSGWISPHPLSTVASEVQSAVPLPPDEYGLGQRITHQEWTQWRAISDSTTEEQESVYMYGPSGQEPHVIEPRANSVSYNSTRVEPWHLYDVSSLSGPSRDSEPAVYAEPSANRVERGNRRGKRSERSTAQAATSETTSSQSQIFGSAASSDFSGGLSTGSQLIHLRMPWDTERSSTANHRHSGL